MDIFYKFSKIYEEIKTEDDFGNSKFFGCEDLLHTEFSKCLVTSNINEEIDELFYFIEDNGELIKCEGNMCLYLLDGCEVVLFNDFEELAIVIQKKHKDDVENFI
jgi:hypothetical protein